MNDDVQPDTPALIDAAGSPLDDLVRSTALSESIRRILGDLDAAAGTVSGWTSYLDEEDAPAG